MHAFCKSCVVKISLIVFVCRDAVTEPGSKHDMLVRVGARGGPHSKPKYDDYPLNIGRLKLPLNVFEYFNERHYSNVLNRATFTTLYY